MLQNYFFSSRSPYIFPSSWESPPKPQKYSAQGFSPSASGSSSGSSLFPPPHQSLGLPSRKKEHGARALSPGWTVVVSVGVVVGGAGAFVFVFKGVSSYSVRPPLFTRHTDRCLVLRLWNTGDFKLCWEPPSVQIVCDFEDSNVAFYCV